MDKHTDNQNEIFIRNLFSNNQSLILETIERIKEKGNCSLIAPMIELMMTSDFDEAKQNIRQLLADIKDEAATKEIVDAIQNERYLPIRQQLISLCWENGLDFTPHLPVFTKLVVEGDYMESFEAMTVIESIEGHITSTMCDELLSYLSSARQNAQNEKAGYIHELIELLPSLVQQ